MLNKPSTTDTDLRDLAAKFRVPLNFVGFRNELPKEPKAGAYIINLQASTDGMGSHWTSFYLAPGKKAFYYDSMGGLPVEEALALMKRWVNASKCGDQDRLPADIFINPFNIQDVDSGFCGQFAIDFLKSIMHNPTKNGFLNHLHKYKLNLRVQKNVNTNI